MTDAEGGPVAAPLVSVVIPTHRRPELLLRRALPSALAQTLQAIEVIVVVDGPDPATEAVLAQVTDSRLRVLVLPQPAGGSVARNAGVEAARAPWIALLDDDDEWMPFKLERQLTAARHSPAPHPVVVSGWIMRTPRGDTPGPARPRLPGESIGDYMLARRSLFSNSCSFMSSVLMAGRALLREVPFTPKLPKHQDWDWILRVASRPDVCFEFVEGAAAVWYFEEEREYMSRSLNWRSSIDWARSMRARGHMSERAYVGFINSHLAPHAQKSGDYPAFLTLLRELLDARPRPFEVVRFLGIWPLPLKLRRGLRRSFDRLRPPLGRPVELGYSRARKG